jgi:uncharacterized protein (TIGR02147 family)
MRRRICFKKEPLGLIERMKKISVYEFQDYRSFLRAKIAAGMHSRTGIKLGNLEQLSAKLGYKSPSTLSMAVNGERIPSANMVQELLEHWRLPNGEQEYFRALVQLAKSTKKGRDPSPILAKLRKLNKTSQSFQYSSSDFEHIRDWHFAVIKELAYTSSFRAEPEWIVKQLRRKITIGQASYALEILERIGVLGRDANGMLRPKVGFTESTHEIPSHAIRQHHKGMLQRAAEALEEQRVEERQFGSLTLRIDQKRLPEAKEALLKFLRHFHQEFESAESESVYQLSAQLFEHTKVAAPTIARGIHENLH